MKKVASTLFSYYTKCIHGAVAINHILCITSYILATKTHDTHLLCDVATTYINNRLSEEAER